MKILRKSFCKKLFIKILVAIFIFSNIAPCSLAANNSKSNQQKIQALKKLENQEKNKLVKNQKQLENTQNSLTTSKARYNDLDSQLRKLEVQLNEATAEYNKSNNVLRSRIRHVYKVQRRGMFQLLFSAMDLNSLLDILYFEKIILKRDYQHILTIKKKSESIMAIKDDIKQKKIALANTINNMNAQQKYIQGAIAKNQSMINKLRTDRKAYERAENELKKQSEKLESTIKKSNPTISYATGGSFLKPIAGSITSPFGWRIHPIFKSKTYHSGIDIGGPNGGAIKASNSGKVIYSGWYGGYGKVVIIDHGVVNGKPTTTLYAHMSSIAVSNGQKVTKGQTIGREGSTGYSTGPHCHFEVRINGKPNDPLRFI